MKVLKVEDCRRMDSGFKVKGLVNTIEWTVGEYISEQDMKQILLRHGVNTVKVEVYPKK